MKVATVVHLVDLSTVSAQLTNSILNLVITIQLLKLGHSGPLWIAVLSTIFLAVSYIFSSWIFTAYIRDDYRTWNWARKTPALLVAPLAFIFGCATPSIALVVSNPMRRGNMDCDFENTPVINLAAFTAKNFDQLSAAVKEELRGITSTVKWVLRLHVVTENTMQQHLLLNFQALLETFPLFVIQLIAVSRGILPEHLLGLVWVSMGSAIVSLLLKSYIGCQSLDPLVCVIRFLFIVYDVNAMIFTIVYMATVGDSILTFAWMIFFGLVVLGTTCCAIARVISFRQSCSDSLRFFSIGVLSFVPVSVLTSFMKFTMVSLVVQFLQPRPDSPVDAMGFAFLRQGDWSERLRFLLSTRIKRRKQAERERKKLKKANAHLRLSKLDTSILELDAGVHRFGTAANSESTKAVQEFVDDVNLSHRSIIRVKEYDKVLCIPHITGTKWSDVKSKSLAYGFRILGVGEVVTAVLFPWGAMLTVIFSGSARAQAPPILWVCSALAGVLLLVILGMGHRFYQYVVFCLEVESLHKYGGYSQPWDVSFIEKYFAPTHVAVLRCILTNLQTTLVAPAPTSDQLQSESRRPTTTEPNTEKTQEEENQNDTRPLLPADIIDRLSSFLREKDIDVSGLPKVEALEYKTWEEEDLPEEEPVEGQSDEPQVDDQLSLASLEVAREMCCR